MTDSRYTGANALSAGKSFSDVTSFSADTPISEVTSLGSAANISAAGKPIQTASANSGISTMAASATTCYKTAGCPSGYYSDADLVSHDMSCYYYQCEESNGCHIPTTGAVRIKVFSGSRNTSCAGSSVYINVYKSSDLNRPVRQESFYVPSSYDVLYNNRVIEIKDKADTGYYVEAKCDGGAVVQRNIRTGKGQILDELIQIGEPDDSGSSYLSSAGLGTIYYDAQAYYNGYATTVDSYNIIYSGEIVKGTRDTWYHGQGHYVVQLPAGKYTLKCGSAEINVPGTGRNETVSVSSSTPDKEITLTKNGNATITCEYRR